jgi:hypothetical protein
MKRVLRIAAPALAGLLVVAHVEAATVIGGSTLLDSAQANQLESWLGEGALTLTNIYTKATGDNSSDFHAAVDGMGRTFVVLSAADDGITRTVGGYNPNSWDASLSDYWFTPIPADRTAFIFNLTDGIRHAQRTTLLFGVDVGITTTYNHPDVGPAFGSGFDLGFNSTSLDFVGYSFLHSYSPNEAAHGTSIVSGLAYDGTNMQVGALEVFTLDVALIPEPQTYAMLLAGLGLLGLTARRKKRLPAA